MEERSKVEDDKLLNPAIQQVMIGVHMLRPLNFYPLSLAHQLELNDLIKQAMDKFLTGQDQGELAFVGWAVDTIRENIGKVLGLITDEADKARAAKRLLEEITNDQLDEIIGLIWKMNYEKISARTKNLVGLLMGVASAASPLGRPSPPLSSDIPVTDSSISSGSGTAMEVLPPAS